MSINRYCTKDSLRMFGALSEEELFQEIYITIYTDKKKIKKMKQSSYTSSFAQSSSSKSRRTILIVSPSLK